MAFAATLGAFTEDLVEIVTAVSAQSDPERFEVLNESALRKIRYHNFLRTNHFQVRNELNGLEERFRVLNRDALADAFRGRLDSLAQFSNKWTPEILHFLLQLSDQPTQKSKLRDLESLKVPDEDLEPPLTWEEVAKEEGWDQDLDLWKNVDFVDDSSDGGYVDTKSDASVESQDTSMSSVEARYRRQPTDYLATIRDEDQKLKTIQETQSWRYQSLAREGNGRSQKVPVSELQVVREVFFMLRGLDNTLFNEQSVPSMKYNLDHASWEVYHDLLGSLGKARRRLAILRRFAKQHQNIPLVQVFQDAVEKRLLTFDRELSKMEAQFVDIKQDVLVQEPFLQFESTSAFGPGSFTPFSEIFNNTFENWMQSKHHAAASTLRQALFESYNLWSVLDDLQHVYLMCNGSQSDAFAFSIFSNIDLLNSKWHDRFGLTEVAREAHNSVVDADRIVVTVAEEHLHSTIVKRMTDEACLGSKLDLIHQCILDILDLTIRLEDARQQESERAEEMKEISRLSMISSPRKSRRGRYIHPSEEEDESFLAEHDRSVLIQDAEKTYADVLVEIGAELDGHLKFMCGGLRGAARASGKDAAVKWDTLAEMLEVGVVQDRGRFNAQLYA
ncbi:hypothetical protein DL764_006460 [Monosporascus ibericus]|uniref:Gamma-Tubulin ring complex non-core subunit mod21 N-terminal domain-containing protein n=1 Tax=Monosporascus ibericus TaxID=155417 RepID=A0A4Q4T4Z7_9PEZI|nr:hypothetical protein DL764_006460 [Monosporascus ibericus]